MRPDKEPFGKVGEHHGVAVLLGFAWVGRGPAMRNNNLCVFVGSNKWSSLQNVAAI